VTLRDLLSEIPEPASMNVNDASIGETTVTIEVSVLGKPGESQTAALWELCRATALEVDGVQRDGSNPYTIIYADKNGQHQLADAWSADIEVGTNIEIISQQPTLKTKIFKDAPSALAGV